jgi:hypothetical protein
MSIIEVEATAASVSTEVTKGDMMAMVAKAGGSDSVRFITDLLESGRRQDESVTNSVIEGLERQLAESQQRCVFLEERLEAIQGRLDWVFWGGRAPS